MTFRQFRPSIGTPHFLIPYGPDFVILHVIWPESQQTAALDLRGQKSISFLGRRGLTARASEFPKMRHWHGYFISQGTWDSDDLATSRFPASFVTLPRRAGAY